MLSLIFSVFDLDFDIRPFNLRKIVFYVRSHRALKYGMPSPS